MRAADFHPASGARAIARGRPGPLPSAAFCTASTVRNSPWAACNSALAVSSAAAPLRSASRRACIDASAASSSDCAARPRSRACCSAAANSSGLAPEALPSSWARSCASRSLLGFEALQSRRRSARCAPAPLATPGVASADSLLNASQRCCQDAISDSAWASARALRPPSPGRRLAPARPVRGNAVSSAELATGRGRPAGSTPACSVLTRSRSVRWRWRSSARMLQRSARCAVASAPAW